MLNNLFPEVVLGLCRLFLDAPKKYRAVEVWRIPRGHAWDWRGKIDLFISFVLLKSHSLEHFV